MALEKSKEIAHLFKRELIVYQRVLRDERTPARAKLFLGLAIGYLCMPFDLIPDFIPIIGHLDDAIIIPALVFAALRSLPPEIVSEHRENVIREHAAVVGIELCHRCTHIQNSSQDGLEHAVTRACWSFYPRRNRNPEYRPLPTTPTAVAVNAARVSSI